MKQIWAQRGFGMAGDLIADTVAVEEVVDRGT